MQRHEATWRPPTRSLRRRYVLRAGHTTTSFNTRVPATAVCPRDRTSCTNRWNAWRLRPAARGYPRCATPRRGRHALQMKQRRPRWRRSQQPSHGHVRPRHRRRARLWPAHMPRLRLNGRGRGEEFTFDEVRGCMRSLKNHKAAGGDGIPSELLKYSCGTGVQVLTHLFDAVLSTRCVPSTWRKDMVVHLAKGGDGGDCSNYRPLTNKLRQAVRQAPLGADLTCGMPA